LTSRRVRDIYLDIKRVEEGTMWDPGQYGRFADQRGRPFFDLVARIGAGAPASVVDLGCGTGELTATLLDRWPAAAVQGVDSSPDMLAEASGRAIPGRLTFTGADMRDWRPAAPVDVIVSNAALQWIPGHAELLPRLVEALASDGWLAFQVPGNFRSPSHVILADLVRDPRYRDRLASAPQPASLEPADYLERLVGCGCEVDVWETTYHHVLQGRDPVVEWVKGSALRPLLAALGSDEDCKAFLTEYGERLRPVYAPRPFGTVLPFRRIFAVAQRR
jgi:trans-aconitate 2-methyltransferase